MSKPTTVEVITVSKGVEVPTSFDLTKEAVIRVPTRTIFVASHPHIKLLEGTLEPIPARYFSDSTDEERWLVNVPIDLNQPTTKIYYNPAIDRGSLFPFTFFKGKRTEAHSDEATCIVVRFLVGAGYDKKKLAMLAGKSPIWVTALSGSVTTPKPIKADPEQTQKSADKKAIIPNIKIVQVEGPSFGTDDFDRVGPTFESRPTG